MNRYLTPTATIMLICCAWDFLICSDNNMLYHILLNQCLEITVLQIKGSMLAVWYLFFFFLVVRYKSIITLKAIATSDPRPYNKMPFHCTASIPNSSVRIGQAGLKKLIRKEMSKCTEWSNRQILADITILFIDTASCSSSHFGLSV